MSETNEDLAMRLVGWADLLERDSPSLADIGRAADLREAASRLQAPKGADREEWAKLICADACVGMSDAAETVERCWRNYLPIVDVLIARLSVDAPAVEGATERREEIARTVDPDAFDQITPENPDEPITAFRIRMDSRRRHALAKADAILALPAAAPDQPSKDREDDHV